MSVWLTTLREEYAYTCRGEQQGKERYHASGTRKHEGSEIGMILGRQQTKALSWDLFENRWTRLPQWNEDEKDGLFVHMPSKHEGSVPTECQSS